MEGEGWDWVGHKIQKELHSRHRGASRRLQTRASAREKVVERERERESGRGGGERG